MGVGSAAAEVPRPPMAATGRPRKTAAIVRRQPERGPEVANNGSNAAADPTPAQATLRFGG